MRQDRSALAALLCAPGRQRQSCERRRAGVGPPRAPDASDEWRTSGFTQYLANTTDEFCWELSVRPCAGPARRARRASPAAARRAATRVCRGGQETERRQSISRGKPSAVTANNPVWKAMLCAPPRAAAPAPVLSRRRGVLCSVCYARRGGGARPAPRRLRRGRREAARDAREEPLLSSFLYAALLSHDTFERSLAFVLANRLSDPTLLATARRRPRPPAAAQGPRTPPPPAPPPATDARASLRRRAQELMSIFYEVLKENDPLVEAALADIIAYRERARSGPAMPCPMQGASRCRPLPAAHLALQPAAPLCCSADEPKSLCAAAGPGVRQVLVGAAVLQGLPRRAGAAPAARRRSCCRCPALCCRRSALAAAALPGDRALACFACMPSCGRPAQVHRIAHQLWLRGQKVMARALQSRIRCPRPPAPERARAPAALCGSSLCGLLLRLAASTSTAPPLHAAGPRG